VNTAKLTEAVQRVLGDPRFAKGAARLKDIYAQVDGAANAATAIRGWLAVRPMQTMPAPADMVPC
jgi:UDP:flavonoid glycosyltransferase YjiC (YdhE family)